MFFKVTERAKSHCTPNKSRCFYSSTSRSPYRKMPSVQPSQLYYKDDIFTLRASKIVNSAVGQRGLWTFPPRLHTFDSEPFSDEHEPVNNFIKCKQYRKENGLLRVPLINDGLHLDWNIQNTILNDWFSSTNFRKGERRNLSQWAQRFDSHGFLLFLKVHRKIPWLYIQRRNFNVFFIYL